MTSCTPRERKGRRSPLAPPSLLACVKVRRKFSSIFPMLPSKRGFIFLSEFVVHHTWLHCALLRPGWRVGHTAAYFRPRKRGGEGPKGKKETARCWFLFHQFLSPNDPLTACNQRQEASPFFISMLFEQSRAAQNGQRSLPHWWTYLKIWSLTDHRDVNAVLGDRRDPQLSQHAWTYFWSDKKRSTLHNRWLCPLRSISFREIVYAITFGERWYIWIRLWWIGCAIFLRLKHDKKKGKRHQDMDLIRSSPNHTICHWYEKAASPVWLDLLIIYTPVAYPHGKIQVIGDRGLVNRWSYKITIIGRIVVLLCKDQHIDVGRMAQTICWK